MRETLHHAKSIYLLTLVLTLLSAVACTPAEVTIQWDSSSLQYITPGSYARVKPIDEHFALVYNIGSRCLIRFSDDRCQSWSEPSLVAENSDYIYTNCEMLQLGSGELLYMWNARPKSGTNHTFDIMYALSSDKGESWSEGKVLYSAGVDFKNGCWEPMALQLPSGEVHIYFANEAPYTQSNEQEITLIRSTDGCKSWGESERISFRANKRDGMATAIYLPHSDEIVVAIEDNGARGRFKPMTIRSRESWRDGCVTGDDPRREDPLSESWRMHDSIYAGAPYLIRLGKEHTLLSIQSTEGRKGVNERYANMQVYVGDRDARNFGNRSTPLPDLGENGHALWNSISQIDDKSVIAVMDVAGYKEGKSGIWSVVGRVVEK